MPAEARTKGINPRAASPTTTIATKTGISRFTAHPGQDEQRQQGRAADDQAEEVYVHGGNPTRHQPDQPADREAIASPQADASSRTTLRTSPESESDTPGSRPPPRPRSATVPSNQSRRQPGRQPPSSPRRLEHEHCSQPHTHDPQPSHGVLIQTENPRPPPPRPVTQRRHPVALARRNHSPPEFASQRTSSTGSSDRPHNWVASSFQSD